MRVCLSVCACVHAHMCEVKKLNYRKHFRAVKLCCMENGGNRETE